MPRAKSETHAVDNYRWSLAEQELLIRLVYRHINDIEYGLARTGMVLEKSNAAWATIENNFNASVKSSRKTTQEYLRRLWQSLKTRMKKERQKVGPKGSLKNSFSCAIENMLPKVEKIPTNPISSPQLEGWSTPESFEIEEIILEDSASDSWKSSEPSTSGSMTVDGYPSTQELPTVPERQCDISSTSSSVERGTSLNTPRVPVPCVGSGLRSLLVGQSYRPSFQSHATAFRPVASAFPAIQPTRMIQANPFASIYYHEMTPRHSHLFQKPPVSAMESPGSLRAFRLPPNSTHTTQHQPVLAPIPQSPLRTGETSRLQFLQNAKMLSQIRHIQALTVMGETLHEYKRRTDEMVANWAKELHRARLQANAATFERQLVMHEMLQKIDEKFHSARVRAEETTANMQKELRDLEMQTAKVEHSQAEMIQRIAELKLQLTDLELQQYRRQSTNPRGLMVCDFIC